MKYYYVQLCSHSTYKLMFTFLRLDGAMINKCGNYTGTGTGLFGTGIVQVLVPVPYVPETGALPTLTTNKITRYSSIRKLIETQNRKQGRNHQFLAASAEILVIVLEGSEVALKRVTKELMIN